MVRSVASTAVLSALLLTLAAAKSDDDASQPGYPGAGADGAQAGYPGGAQAGADGAQPGYPGGGGAAGADGKQAGYSGGADGAQTGYGADMEQDGYQDALKEQLGDTIQDGLMKKGGKNKPLCLDTETAIQKKDHRFGTNRARAGLILKRTPKYAELFEDCATYGHDLCLQSCGTSKLGCQNEFEVCLTKTCGTRIGDGDAKECLKAVQTNVMGVKMVGKIAFQGSQKGSCDCIPDADVPMRRKQELESFFAKWAPDQKSKVDKLLEKYQHNYPNLLVSLHQKYREAVKIQERSQEEIFKADKFAQDAKDEVMSTVKNEKKFMNAKKDADAAAARSIPHMDEL